MDFDWSEDPLPTPWPTAPPLAVGETVQYWRHRKGHPARRIVGQIRRIVGELALVDGHDARIPVQAVLIRRLKRRTP